MRLAPIAPEATHDVIRTNLSRRDVFPAVLQAQTFPGARVIYPERVSQALRALFSEYNASFAQLVDANREWPEDYQYCPRDGQNLATPIIQIDMAGLNANQLSDLAERSPQEVVGILRGRIFEFENSWAAYRAHAINPSDDSTSAYDILSREMLDDLSQRHGKPIALLATTPDKFASMALSEFGMDEGATVPDATVRRLTGFDRFFGPDQFRKYLRENGGQCDYLLYVRASDSPDRLRDRTLDVDNDLLANPEHRRIIKAHALTFNIDNPDWSDSDARRINDTKMYLTSMGLAATVTTADELASVAADFGNIRLRAKPALGAYGCYGHEVGYHSSKKFRYRMRQNLNSWGSYVVQPEVSPARAINDTDGAEFVFMDRVFCAILADGPRFIGGQRVFLPVDSMEVKKGRLHIVRNSFVSEITSAEAQVRTSAQKIAA